MKKKRNWIRIVLAVVVVAIIVLAVGKKQGWLGKESYTKISTEKVEKKDIVETVSANGKIQPEIEVKVSPDISGEVIELYVIEGDDVKEGDILARIDPEIYKSTYDRIVASLNTQKANLSNTKARLAQARAQYSTAKLNFERNEKLWKQGVISDSEYESIKSGYDVASAEVEAAEQSAKAAEYTVRSAEASVVEARENLTKTTIYAPTDGTVSRLNVEKGERVVGASQFSSGTEIMRIANLAGMEVNVSVNENDIVRVSLHDTCIIEVDAYLDEKFKGLVTEIATSANTTGVSVDQVTNFDVKIRILPGSYSHIKLDTTVGHSPFRPGMSATVDIQTETTRDVLAVPIQAVTTRSDTASSGDDDLPEDMKANQAEDDELIEYVFKYENGTAVLTKVETGIQDNSFIRITSGLTEGDEIITAPYRAVSKKLKDGDKVEKVKKEELFK